MRTCGFFSLMLPVFDVAGQFGELSDALVLGYGRIKLFLDSKAYLV
jgi:hypothetical protein